MYKLIPIKRKKSVFSGLKVLFSFVLKVSRELVTN